jgi:hypothetical protein
MNITEATKTITHLLAGADVEPKDAVKALRVWELEGGLIDVVDAAYDRFPGLLNYDEKGNWIGNVANENGWTA